MEELSVRIVTDEQELNSVIEIRQQVFVIEQGVLPELEMDELDEKALHIIADYRGQPIATCRLIFLPNECVKLERMAVLKSFRDKGVGRQILDYVDKEIKSRQIKLLVIHAQFQAISFYESSGFKSVGLPFWEAGIKHLKMEKQVN